MRATPHFSGVFAYPFFARLVAGPVLYCDNLYYCRLSAFARATPGQLLGIGFGVGVSFPRPRRGTGGVRCLIFAFAAVGIVVVALPRGGSAHQGCQVAFELCKIVERSLLVSFMYGISVRLLRVFLPYFGNGAPGSLALARRGRLAPKVACFGWGGLLCNPCEPPISASTCLAFLPVNCSDRLPFSSGGARTVS